MNRDRGLAFTIPALVLFGLFVVLPAIQAFSYSLLDWPGYGPSKFIGFSNYKELLSDGIFYRSLLQTIALAVVSVAIQIPIALGFALAFCGTSRFSRGLRSLTFSPMIMPSSVIAVLFLMLYNPAEGLIPAAFRASFGTSPDFLGSDSLAMLSVFAAICWRFIGFHMMLMLAGLATIEPSLYEAAALDGAGPFSTFRRIVLPAIAPTLRLSALLAILGSLKYFDLVMIMTRGGPNHSSELLTTYLYKQGIDNHRYGYSGAIATLLLLIAIAIGYGVSTFRSKRFE